MNCFQWNKILTLSVVIATSMAMSAHARIVYEWNDGKLHGWHHVKSSSAKAGYYDLSFIPVAREHECNADKGTFFLGENQSNDSYLVDWSKWPEPGSGVHQTVWIESPAFKLDGSGPLTYYGVGNEGPINPATGQRNMSLVDMTVPEVAGTWGAESQSPPDTAGILAVGLRDAATGKFVLSKNFPGGMGFQKCSFSAEELAPFVKSGRAYTLNVVDALCGRYSWCAIDRVTIPGKLLVAEPISFSTIIWIALKSGGVILGVGLMFLWWKGRKARTQRKLKSGYRRAVASVRTDASGITDDQQTPSPFISWVHLVYSYVTTAAFLFVAFLMYYAIDSTDPLLSKKDLIFGIRNESLLWWTTGVFFAAAVFILINLSKGKAMNAIWAALLVGSSSVVYGVGFWMNPPGPANPWDKLYDVFPIVILTAKEAGVEPHAFFIYWKVFIGFLVIGSILVLLAPMLLNWFDKRAISYNENSQLDDKQTAIRWGHLVYLYVAAVLCLILALLMCCAIGSSNRLLGEKDLLFGIKNAHLLLCFAGMFFTAAVIILMSLIKCRATNAILAVLWVGLNLVVYSVGIWMSAPHNPWNKPNDVLPIITLTARQAGFGPHKFYSYWNLFIAYLMVGSILLLFTSLILNWRKKSLQSEACWNE